MSNPCPKGHTDRYPGGRCKACVAESMKNSRAARIARYPGKKQFRGNPCQRGHSGWRYVKGNECVLCVSAKRKLAYAAKILSMLAVEDTGGSG